ncbi:MAG: type II secretion system F family protein [Candidatus Aenigmarchaeota archaeon]|nr:type II secretion system F family protein [Candidatus Aenigmarchaeota archaeon]MDW8149399.1 type II secretion system F family protein [Candidatus Aenigmarchaeota archaeon]
MVENIVKISTSIFGYLSFFLTTLFPDLQNHLKKAKYKRMAFEHISVSLFYGLMSFVATLPFFSILSSFLTKSAIVGYLLSIIISFSLFFAVFFIVMNYPKIISKQIAKQVDDYLPFITLNMSLLASSKLPFDKVILMVGRLKLPPNVKKEIDPFVYDITNFGLNVREAIEKEIERVSSENFKELLYGISSLLRTGGDLSTFLKEKSKSYILEYKRKLLEFARKLGIFTQIYLMLIVVASIFLTVLLTVFGAISGIGETTILIQFFLIVIVIPMVSFMFVFLIKSITPSSLY